MPCEKYRRAEVKGDSDFGVTIVGDLESTAVARRLSYWFKGTLSAWAIPVMPGVVATMAATSVVAMRRVVNPDLKSIGSEGWRDKGTPRRRAARRKRTTH